jgi:hypothetical protein
MPDRKSKEFQVNERIEFDCEEIYSSMMRGLLSKAMQ